VSTEFAERLPAIVAVADDAHAARDLERLPQRRFGPDYRIAVASSARDGLAALRSLREEGADVALIVADQSMPQMSGVEFLATATGADLAGRAYRQAWFFGARFLIGRNVTALRAEGDKRVLVLDDGSEVGDVRLGSMKRVAAAVGEGSSAVRMVHDYCARLVARDA